jgi:hypothetical protein
LGLGLRLSRDEGEEEEDDEEEGALLVVISGSESTKTQQNKQLSPKGCYMVYKSTIFFFKILKMM